MEGAKMKTPTSNAGAHELHVDGAVPTSSWLRMKWLTCICGYRLLHARHAPKGIFLGRVVCDSTWWLRRSG